METDTSQRPARGYSGSTTGLSASDLHQKALCDTVANVAKGCAHGCEFCYLKASPQYVFDPGGEIGDHGFDGSDDWGAYALYRDRLPATVARELERGIGDADAWTPKGRGVVGLSFGTDPYFDPEAARITGITLRLLRDHGRPARVLTRNPALAYHAHGDLYRELAELGLVTVGTSVPSLDAADVAAIEPRAPAPSHRLRGLQQFADSGVPVYVSASPTYPTMTREDLQRLLEAAMTVDPSVVFHEPINPRRGNMADCRTAAEAAGRDDLAAAFHRLDDSPEVWARYARRQFAAVQSLADAQDVPIHLWPDESLPTHVDGDWAWWLRQWRAVQSPEPWPDRPARPPEKMPDLPTPDSTQATFSDLPITNE